MKDTQFMTAKEKELTLRQWRTFIQNGMQFKHFSKRIYHHLTQHCEFIAHFDRSGFYSVYFDDPENSIRFLRQFDPKGDHKSVEYRSTLWWTDPEYRDLNVAMSQVVGEHLEELMRQLQEQAKEKDLAQARALLAKHGITWRNGSPT